MTHDEWLESTPWPYNGRNDTIDDDEDYEYWKWKQTKMNNQRPIPMLTESVKALTEATERQAETIRDLRLAIFGAEE